MSNVEFSIVIPTHNGEAYIGQAIESVLAQTYPHFEIIVLEHQSNDRTIEIVRSYNDPRVRISSTNQPQTIESNWGRILDLDLAEYLTILGHDDIFYPEFLAEMALLIISEPEASLYQEQFEYIDPLGNRIRQAASVAYKETGSQFLSAVMEDREEIVATGYVMRSADYRQVGGVPAYPGLLYADVVLWYLLANLSYKVCSPKTFVGFRMHPRNMHRNANFSIYYQATRQYYDFLLTTSELKDDPTAVHAYINQQLQLSYRIAVVQAILSPSEGRAQLQIAKQQIAKDGLFTLYDRAARIYEMIPPLPAWLRRIVLLPIIWRRTLRRIFAKH